ncbi:MAG: methylmalonyl-CoA epimerase [Nitrososphaerota archaeon]
MTSVRRLEHIGIAVNDINSVLPFYLERMGLTLAWEEDVPEEKVKIAMLSAGDVYIELLEPTSSESSVYKFLQKRGEGLHHIAFEVEDVDSAVTELREKEIKIVYSHAKSIGNKRKINFIHPSSSHGVLVELIKRYKLG